MRTKKQKKKKWEFIRANTTDNDEINRMLHTFLPTTRTTTKLKKNFFYHVFISFNAHTYDVHSHLRRNTHHSLTEFFRLLLSKTRFECVDTRACGYKCIFSKTFPLCCCAPVLFAHMVFRRNYFWYALFGFNRNKCKWTKKKRAKKQHFFRTIFTY